MHLKKDAFAGGRPRVVVSRLFAVLSDAPVFIVVLLLDDFLLGFLPRSSSTLQRSWKELKEPLRDVGILVLLLYFWGLRELIYELGYCRSSSFTISRQP